MKTSTFKKYLPAILALLVLAFSCTRKEMLTEDDMRAITQKYNEQLEHAFLQQDLASLATLYDANARLSPNGDDFYVGRNAILDFWKQDFSSSKLMNMHTNTLSVSGTSDVIYETGITTTETQYLDSLYHSEVKFINVWKRQPDGTYQLAIDFWNSPKK